MTGATTAARSTTASSTSSEHDGWRKLSSHESQNIFFGWLWKQGRSGFKSWKKRFFVLNGTYLAYYDQCTLVLSSTSSLRSFDATPKGSLQISSVALSSKSEFGLVITGTTGRKLYIQAGGQDPREQWLTAITSAINNSQDNEVLIKGASSSSSSSTSSSCRSTVSETGSEPTSDNTSSARVVLSDRGRNSPVKCSKQGWLVKQGSKFHTWKRRYFVLKGTELTYHKSPSNSPPLNTTTGRISAVDIWYGKPFGIKVTYSSGRELLVQADDEKSRQEWYDAIQRELSLV